MIIYVRIYNEYDNTIIQAVCAHIFLGLYQLSLCHFSVQRSTNSNDTTTRRLRKEMTIHTRFPISHFIPPEHEFIHLHFT